MCSTVSDSRTVRRERCMPSCWMKASTTATGGRCTPFWQNTVKSVNVETSDGIHRAPGQNCARRALTNSGVGILLALED